MARLTSLVSVSNLTNQEMVLAQEQGVLHKSGLGKEIQGTLVLTNTMLIFVAANTEIPSSPGLGTIQYYADVNDLNSIGQNPPNMIIPLETILTTKGSKGIMTNPNLKIKLKAVSAERTEEFVQTIIGGRKKNLNDWATVIENLKSGKIIPKTPSWLPDKDSLEGRIVSVLRDLQEKGLFEIENEIESKYKIDLDPDEVEEACNKLTSKGILEKKNEEFYRLQSPLGSDDLSS
ncbi:MAG: hypothetical protein JRN67_01545 [Nitrososphaerota archaeon]|nr:hypothetical protein [Nitrososphaerota archaeon]